MPVDNAGYKVGIKIGEIHGIEIHEFVD